MFWEQFAVWMGPVEVFHEGCEAFQGAWPDAEDVIYEA
jgi:hypothetical protein